MHSPTVEHITNKGKPEYRTQDISKNGCIVILYKRRWAILFVFSLLSCSNSLLWNSFSPVASYAIDYYGVSNFQINLFSLAFLFIYVPGVFGGSYILHKKGLRFGVVGAALLQAIGAWIRYVGSKEFVPNNNSKFAIVLCGQILAALATLCILQVPPLIAGNWFGTNERALATAIGGLANQLGIAVGFLMSPALVRQPADIPLMLLVYAGIVSSITMLVLFIFQSHPPSPPSLVVSFQQQQKQQKENYGRLYLSVLEERNFILLAISFGISLSSFYALCTLLDQILVVVKYTSNDAGLFGFLLVVVGLFGALLAGFITDKTHRYKEIMCAAYSGCFLSVLWFALSLVPDNNIILAICCSIIGFFFSAIIPITLGYFSLCPVSEEVSSTLLTNAANLFGIALVVVLNFFVQTQNRDFIRIGNFLLAGLNALSILSIVFFKPTYRRLLIETEVLETSVCPSGKS